MMDNIDIAECQVGEKSWMCPVNTCKKSLSRKQTLRSHLLTVHGINDDVPHKRYKMYEFDPSIEMPRRTAARLRQRSREEEPMLSATGDVEVLGTAVDANDTESEGEQFSDGSSDSEESLKEMAPDTDGSLQETNPVNVDSVVEPTQSSVDISHELEETVQRTASDNFDSLTDMQDTNTGSDMEIVSDESYHSYVSDSDTEVSFYDSDGTEVKNKTGGMEISNDAPLYVIQGSDSLYESPLNYKEHLLAVCAYVSRHNCSDTQFKDLLALLNLHVPANNIMETDIDKVKSVCGFSKDFLKFHFYCSICKRVFDEDIDQCQTNGCSGNQELTKNYYVTGNIEKQLSDVLLRQDIWQSIQDQSKVSTKSITDITNGTEYQALKESGQFLEDSNNITLSLFTDGVPLFKSSGVSIWPVYLLVNEIPRKQRFLRKNMILWGVWQGVGKPNMTMYLKPLVQDLNRLYVDGIQLTIDGKQSTCKAKLILVTMDLQARASVLHMTQHNGEFSCNFCMVQGEVVKSGKGHTRVFAFKENGYEPRTLEDIRNDARTAQQEKKRVNGFTGESVFLYLKHFSLCSNVGIDYMHGVLLGVSKKLLSLWTDTRNSDRLYYIGDHIKALDKAMKGICPPYMVSRLPRKVSVRDHWKASEYQSWLLFYAVPCLKGKLEQTYLVHFSTLIEAVYILLGEGITQNDLQKAESLIIAFLKHSEDLYGKSVMGLNFHNLIHLVPTVKKWGPLWAWSCFCFESFNGELKKSVHGTGNVCRQIFWSMQVQKKLETENIKEQAKVGEFIRGMMNNAPSSKESQEYYQCLVPECKELEGNLPQSVKNSLENLTESCSVKDYEKSKKIIRNGFHMYSKSCSRVKRRNSYTLQLVKPLQDGALAVEVDYYLVKKSNRHVFAVGKRMKPVHGVLANRVPHLQIYEYCTNVAEVVPAELLESVLVVVNTDNVCCLGAMPNTIEKD